MPNQIKSSKEYAHQTRSEPPSPSAIHLGTLVGVAVIVVAVFIVYLPCINGDFIVDDNDIFITNNQIIKVADGLYRFWFTTEPFDYWPVTNTTFWIEWRLWGMSPTGYHVSNLILHVIDALLIWLVLRRMSVPGAFLAALIFAVHPVNVASVAYISNRKNLLAMLFFLVSVWVYLKSEGLTPGARTGAKQTPSTAHCPPPNLSSFILHPSSFSLWYWLSLASFIVAMLSKGSAAILPVILLGIISWRRPLTPWDFVKITPFFLIAICLTWVNVWFQTHGTGEVIRNAGFVNRLLGAGGVVWFYLYKALLPIELSCVYPLWQVETGNPFWWMPLLAVLAVTAVFWLFRNDWSRPLLFTWGFFCVSLVPVMGFTDTIFMRYSLVADHYQHFAIIGVIALAAASWSAWLRRMCEELRWEAIVIAFLAVGALSSLAWRQSGLWRDEITLFQDAVKNSPDSWMVHYSLGKSLSDAGRHQEAIEHYEQSLRFLSNIPEVHNNLGIDLVRTGRYQEAIEQFEKALRLNPKYINARFNLGNVLFKTGRLQEAIDHYNQVLALKADYPDAHANLGNALVQTGRPLEAIEHFQQALSFKPESSEVLNNLGAALVQLGRPEEAIDNYKHALRLRPDYISAYYNLALAYAKLRLKSEAVAAAQMALELARSQRQTTEANHIEDWLKSYRAGSNDE